MKQALINDFPPKGAPAAFRRLCVETLHSRPYLLTAVQPPLGGCVLKLVENLIHGDGEIQPPLGGCVLKQIIRA